MRSGRGVVRWASQVVRPRRGVASLRGGATRLRCGVGHLYRGVARAGVFGDARCIPALLSVFQVS